LFLLLVFSSPLVSLDSKHCSPRCENFVILRLRGAGSSQHDVQPPPSKKDSLRHSSADNSTAARRLRIPKYQSRILFLGQLPYDVTKDQV
jgi:hypothetical protein